MARQNLERNAKFKELVRKLGIPKPYVRGLLETMWDVAGEDGNPVLGTPDRVEAAAEWPGDAGAWFAALRDGHWIDRVKGKWVIHDYWDHAPEYVRARSGRENERKIDKVCACCKGTYRSSDRRSKHCSSACRTAAWREKSVTDCGGLVTDASVTVTDSDTTPPLPPPRTPPPVLNTRARIGIGGAAVKKLISEISRDRNGNPIPQQQLDALK